MEQSPRLNKVFDYILNGSFSDTYFQGDLPHGKLGMEVDVEKDMGVIGKKRPLFSTHWNLFSRIAFRIL